MTKPPFTASDLIWTGDDAGTTAQKEGRVVPFGRCQSERVDQLRDLYSVLFTRVATGP